MLNELDDREKELEQRERELDEREQELNNRKPSLTEALNHYINKTFFPEVDGLSKIIIFLVELFHIVFSLISPIGFFLPSKFLIYHAMGLSLVLFGWMLFDGCILTILKSKFFGVDDPLIDSDFGFMKTIQVFFILLTLSFYVYPSISPFVFLKRGVNFLDKL